MQWTVAVRVMLHAWLLTSMNLELYYVLLSLYTTYTELAYCFWLKFLYLFLCPIHTADATKLFCRVGVGVSGVNTIRN